MKTLRAPFAPVLPDEYNALIGKIFVSYAFFEMRLQELVFVALGVDETRGRLAVKSMRSSEMIDLAIELARLDGISFLKVDSGSIKEMESRRNLLAHGVWLSDGERLYLRDLSGSMRINGKKVQKKVAPAGVPITIQALQSLVDVVQKATQDTERAILALQAQLAALPEKHHVQP